MGEPARAARIQGDRYAFLFLDVDGYCSGGIDQRRVVSPDADGYRARELGWAFFTASASGAGSVYFCDLQAPRLQIDAGVSYVYRMHGLPVEPAPDAYGVEPVLCSTRLLDAFRAVHDAVAQVTGLPVAIVHKGGNEGFWANQCLPGTPTVDLGLLGCPKVDTIGRGAPHLHAGRQCGFHAPVKRRTQKIVHCPRLEVEMLAGWVFQSAGLGAQ